jgi:disulfide oxidoreductase YuzD
VQKQALKIFKKKLYDALCVVDDATLSEGSAILKDISPASSCPFARDVMRNIQHVLARGQVLREQVALKLISKTVTSYENLISPKFIEELMEVVTRAFPRDHYVQFAKNVQSVYEWRAFAQKNKFDEPTFEHELSLISVSATNMSNQVISRVRTILDDALLKKVINKPNWWVRALSMFWEFLTAPLFKWVFGILTAILVTALVAYFG